MSIRWMGKTWIGMTFALVLACGSDGSDSPKTSASADAGADADADGSGGDGDAQLDAATDVGADAPSDAYGDAAIDTGAVDAGPAQPDAVDVAMAPTLVDGEQGTWSASASRGYATQSRLPYLNGGFGSTTAECGLQGQILKVTNLKDSGPGSLRAAVETPGKRTVVFEVSGVIKLASPLWIGEPFLTIAGQTAPPPGISLHHEQVKVRAKEVCIQHLRVRVGDRQADGSLHPAGSGDQIDGVSIYNPSSTEPMSNVILDNLSVSWSSDEAVPIGGTNLSDVTVRDLLVAEPLNDNLHEKGAHAYCLLSSSYGANPKRIAFIGNVAAHCVRRAPRIDEGTIVVVNTLVYNPGVYAIQLWGNDPSEDLHTTIVGNLLRFPSDDANLWKGVPGNMGFVKALVQNFYEGAPRDVRVYLAGNSSAKGLPEHLDEAAFGQSTTPSQLLAAAEVWHPTIFPIAPSEAEAVILSNAGAFPKHRDEVDQRIVADIEGGTGTFIDSQDEVGGYPLLAENHRVLTPPSDPSGDGDNDGVSNIIEWLQGFTDAVE